MTDARALAERLFEIIDGHRWADVDTVLHGDAVLSSPFGHRLTVPAWLEVNRSFAVACPDGHHTITDVVDAGDRFAVEGMWTGTHTGPMTGPAGSIAPTGRSVVLPFCGVAARRDQRIASVTVYLDQTAMLTQLGLVAEPATAR
ncbi:ester cyclase [Geodermatophilus sp. YIM 151500]|uniref:ester cyclase n=1 Tax=Geodermatophilus sp. YIM 151500 TaxID=2984531 RepID=UPI0021E36A84|nr:ester cyclase [Geodermatophilus sp. YIM 151500]MCV2489218.1 ester cyclase [Geodermatophilus sp. YIM 151500]